MDKDIKEKVQCIMNEVNGDGLRWKKGKDIKHLKTRKEYGHIPIDFTLEDYENVIMTIINSKKNDVFIYSVDRFNKDYFVFGDGEWIVIIGDDAIMETSFHINGNYATYLSKKKGYKYIGTVEEVFN